ncbi:MAG: FAD-dependent oxidoreductase [Rhodobacteraceae bacterium]|nr:FAD-dependent oxidoreductase [Paracoccaceae bacterium]
MASLKSLVLVGAGHTHALVLRDLRGQVPADVCLTVIDPQACAVYSGMLPGCVAGHYSRDQPNIDVAALARGTGAKFVNTAVVALDPGTRQVILKGGDTVPYDVASFDVGITCGMPQLPGFTDHGVPAKPLPAFVASWESFRDSAEPAAIAVIGGGIAGAELAMAMAYGLQARRRACRIALIDRGTIPGGVSHGAARRIRAALDGFGVAVHENTDIARITAKGVELADNILLPANFVAGAAGATPHPWLAETGLNTTGGYITVGTTLQSSDADVFAAGDCAHFAPAPLPKAGVYAVRKAPVLRRNLLSRVRGERLREFRPQSDFLKLITLGGQRAVAEKFGISASGTWAWKMKNRIDRGFMNSF